MGGSSGGELVVLSRRPSAAAARCAALAVRRASATRAAGFGFGFGSDDRAKPRAGIDADGRMPCASLIGVGFALGTLLGSTLGLGATLDAREEELFRSGFLTGEDTGVTRGVVRWLLPPLLLNAAIAAIDGSAQPASIGRGGAEIGTGGTTGFF